MILIESVADNSIDYSASDLSRVCCSDLSCVSLVISHECIAGYSSGVCWWLSSTVCYDLAEYVASDRVAGYLSEMCYCSGVEIVATSQ